MREIGTILSEKRSIRDPLRQHRVRDLLKARDVRADHEITLVAVLLRRVIAAMEDILHNALELRVHLVKGIHIKRNLRMTVQPFHIFISAICHLLKIYSAI